ASRVVETASAFGHTGVLGLEAVGFEAIARSEGVIGDALVARYLAPLDAEIVETLRALFAHELSAERTAEALQVHPHTVRNRLRRFEELTGASLRSVEQISEIRLALLRTSVR